MAPIIHKLAARISELKLLKKYYPVPILYRSAKEP